MLFLRLPKARPLYFTAGRKWRNWYQNEGHKQIKGVDSTDKVKHNEKSDQLFLERMNCDRICSHISKDKKKQK